MGPSLLDVRMGGGLLLKHLDSCQAYEYRLVVPASVPLVRLCARREGDQSSVKWGEVGTGFAITLAATCATVFSRTSRPCPGHRDCSEE